MAAVAHALSRVRAPYSYPAYYDVAFSTNRDTEAAFLVCCFRRYSSIAVRGITDIACGTGPHLLRLAALGYRMTGFDLSRANIAYVTQQARLRGLDVCVTVQDMTAFELPAPVDAAICMQDSQGHLLTNDALVAHLRAVARNLRPGGIYVFDRLIPHRWTSPTAQWAWTKRGRGLSVRTTFRTLQDYDPVRQVCEEVMRFEVTEDGTRRVITQRHKTRIVFPQELLALVELAGGFEFCGWFSNFSLNRPLERARAALMMITVLRRT